MGILSLHVLRFKLLCKICKKNVRPILHQSFQLTTEFTQKYLTNQGSKQQLLGKKLRFLENPKHFNVGKGLEGSGGSENPIYKILYGEDPRIGTQGTQMGSKGSFFLNK